MLQQFLLVLAGVAGEGQKLGLRPDIDHAEHGNSVNRIQDDPMTPGSGQGNLRMGNPRGDDLDRLRPGITRRDKGHWLHGNTGAILVTD